MIRDCCDGSRRHLGLGLVKGRVTDTKLVVYLLFVAKWHFAKPTHVRKGAL